MTCPCLSTLEVVGLGCLESSAKKCCQPMQPRGKSHGWLSCSPSGDGHPGRSHRSPHSVVQLQRSARRQGRSPPGCRCSSHPRSSHPSHRLHHPIVSRLMHHRQVHQASLHHPSRRRPPPCSSGCGTIWKHHSRLTRFPAFIVTGTSFVVLAEQEVEGFHDRDLGEGWCTSLDHLLLPGGESSSS